MPTIWIGPLNLAQELLLAFWEIPLTFQEAQSCLPKALETHKQQPIPCGLLYYLQNEEKDYTHIWAQWVLRPAHGAVMVMEPTLVQCLPPPLTMWPWASHFTSLPLLPSLYSRIMTALVSQGFLQGLRSINRCKVLGAVPGTDYMLYRF